MPAIAWRVSVHPLVNARNRVSKTSFSPISMEEWQKLFVNSQRCCHLQIALDPEPAVLRTRRAVS